jgi:hypothetical protein
MANGNGKRVALVKVSNNNNKNKNKNSSSFFDNLVTSLLRFVKRPLFIVVVALAAFMFMGYADSKANSSFKKFVESNIKTGTNATFGANTGKIKDFLINEEPKLVALSLFLPATVVASKAERLILAIGCFMWVFFGPKLDVKYYAAQAALLFLFAIPALKGDRFIIIIIAAVAFYMQLLYPSD